MRFFTISLFFVVFLVSELMALEDFHMHLSRKVNRAAGCQDVYSQCPDWANRGACKSSKYTNEQKRTLCGVSCNLCKGSSGGSKNMGGDMGQALGELKQPLGELVNNLNFIVKAVKGKLVELAQQNS